MEGSFGSKPKVCFEVQKIIGISSDGNYQVQWAPVWVSKFHLVGCEHLIQEFLQEQSQKMNELPQETPSQTESNDNVEQSHDVSSLYRVEDDCSAKEDFEPVEDERCQLEGRDNCEKNDQQFIEPGSVNDFDAPETINFIVKVEENEPEMITEPSTLPVSETSSTTFDMHQYCATMPFSTYTTEVPKRGNMSSMVSGENSFPFIQVDSNSLRKYGCSYCHKQFFNEAHLVAHLRSHTGARPFVCSHCQKAFTQLGNLNKHLLTHTGEKPFHCDHCGKSFRQKVHLKTHIRRCTTLPL